MVDSNQIIPVELIERRIYMMRGQKVMFDNDLADLYGVETKVLNQAVTRNRNRFPDDFMFRLSSEEYEALNRSQFVTGSQKHRDPRFLPRAFTQEGIAMLSGVLRSQQAIEVNIAIMRTFVHMRKLFESHKELAAKMIEHDGQIAYLFQKVEQLTTYPVPKKHPIGFVPEKDEK